MTQSDLIVFSHLRWRFVWQRPQHLISRIGRARRTWFIEEPIPAPVDEPRLCHEQVDGVNRVWMEVPGKPRHMTFGDPDAPDYLDRLQELIGSPKNPLAWLYTPMALDIAQAFQPGFVVYDVMDDLTSFKNAPAPLLLREKQALATADLVFAGGRSLFERVCRRRSRASHLFPSGVDPEHYAAARQRAKWNDRPVAGYVGVIDERLDLDLIEGLADALPDWEIRMVGPVVKIDEGELPRPGNVTYPGQKTYGELPHVMGGFDVALMPFALNEATAHISPTKTLEYLAAGLPVVSTRVPDVVNDYGHVVDLQEGSEGFARACERVISHSLEERDVKVEPLLQLHKWDSIASRMEQLIVEASLSRNEAARELGEEATIS